MIGTSGLLPVDVSYILQGYFINKWSFPLVSEHISFLKLFDKGSSLSLFFMDTNVSQLGQLEVRDVILQQNFQ